MNTELQTREDVLAEETRPPDRKGGGCARGCLFAFIGFIVLCVVAAILVAVFHRKLIAAGARPFVQHIVESLPLSAEEIADAKVVASDLMDAWERGAVDLLGIIRPLEDLKNAPEAVALTLAVLEYDDIGKWNDVPDASPSAASPLGSSGLTSAEKERFAAAGRQFVAALSSNLIPDKTMDAFWNTLTPRRGGGHPGRSGLASQIDDTQLRALLSLMESDLKGKAIPPAPAVNPQDGVRRVLDKLKQVRDRAAGPKG